MENAGIRNLRDFLLQYNKISESCFLNCVNHLSDRSLSQDECGCVDMCTKKHVSVNHKVMQVYMEIQPILIKKRIEDMNEKQASIEETSKNTIADKQKSEISTTGKPKVEDISEQKKLVSVRPDSDMPEKDLVRTVYQ